MNEGDLLARLSAPAREGLTSLLPASVEPRFAEAAMEGVFEVGLFAALVLPLASGVAALHRRAGAGARLGIGLGSLVIAAALLGWLLSVPSDAIWLLFRRFDHAAFCLFAGLGFAQLGPSWRKLALATLSLLILTGYAGTPAVVAVFGACAGGYALLHLPGGRRPRNALLLQGAVMSAAYAYALTLRAGSPTDALETHGLIFLVFLRHISFVVTACKQEIGSPPDYLCFLSFYPGANGPVGGPEVYQEFSRRNLRARTHFDLPRAGRMMVRGTAQLWLAERIPISVEAQLASAGSLALWGNSLLLYVRVALMVMGYWALIEACALAYGIRLRTNFLRLLSLRNPSELWRSWRGSLTNWLIVHVYAPLGANRRHQSLNILAAFAVSAVWHALGTPFLTSDWSLRNAAPVTLWAALNAAAVVGHVHYQRWRGRPPATGWGPRRLVATALTLVLASFTVTLLNYQGPAIDQFPGYLRMLAGGSR